MPVIRRDIGEHIHADGIFQVAGIEIRQMVGSLWRDMAKQFFGKITVRINDTHAVAERNVLDDQIAQKCRFASAGLSDDVDMLALVLFGYAKALGMTPAFALSNDDAWF
ncbi:MAG TPA: hypothetical protein VN873_18195 [Candidatus Angelobacter sp.]|nr:hypothetical protein [Candidatus Angelobacter sp.]